MTQYFIFKIYEKTFFCTYIEAEDLTHFDIWHALVRIQSTQYQLYFKQPKSVKYRPYLKKSLSKWRKNRAQLTKEKMRKLWGAKLLSLQTTTNRLDFDES